MCWTNECTLWKWWLYSVEGLHSISLITMQKTNRLRTDLEAPGQMTLLAVLGIGFWVRKEYLSKDRVHGVIDLCNFSEICASVLDESHKVMHTVVVPVALANHRNDNI